MPHCSAIAFLKCIIHNRAGPVNILEVQLHACRMLTWTAAWLVESHGLRTAQGPPERFPGDVTQYYHFYTQQEHMSREN